MLQQLHIKNYAIIDELHIDFRHGLNIITGETGAGKSILMGALNLILGQRADSSILQDATKKCTVEGVFTISKSEELVRFFKEQDLDELQEEVLVRREINAGGKSRSFINDTPATLAQVKQLGTMLVDLHQQFDTLDIHTSSFSFKVLDAMAGNGALIKKLSAEYHQFAVCKKQLNEWKLLQDQSNRELDYHQYLYDELEQLALKEHELETLETEWKLLSDAENIKQQLTAIYSPIQHAEPSLLQQLKSLFNKLKGMNDIHASLPALAERMNAVAIELSDIADDIEHIESSIKYDPERIQLVSDRMAAGYKLLKKHGVQSTAELLHLQKELEHKLLSVSNLSEQINIAEKKLAELHDICNTTAKQISTNRIKAAAPFASAVNGLLHQVGMPNAKMLVDVNDAPLSETGANSIEFLFDANKSGKMEPIAKVASGGELSRLMLSIKSLVAKELALPTLIFDEIDTGISGEAARQVGIIMKSLSGNHQLIAITHQPQIAAKADSHYFVYKESKGQKIKTAVKLLDEDERIVAIAKMLSGEKPSSAALENAKDLMVN